MCNECYKLLQKQFLQKYKAGAVSGETLSTYLNSKTS